MVLTLGQSYGTFIVFKFLLFHLHFSNSIQVDLGTLYFHFMWAQCLIFLIWLAHCLWSNPLKIWANKWGQSSKLWWYNHNKPTHSKQGGCLNRNLPFFQQRNSHYKDKRLSYLHNRDPKPGKTLYIETGPRGHIVWDIQHGFCIYFNKLVMFLLCQCSPSTYTVRL